MSANVWNQLNARRYQPSLPLPPGFDKESILKTLASLSIDGSATGELKGYATADCERFLHTLALIPENAEGELLEIGSNPYFTTLLLMYFRPKLSLTLVNYFGGESFESEQVLEYVGFDGQFHRQTLKYLNCNTETTPLPFEKHRFDWVIYCEVLEHMTQDPARVLLELKRVMKEGAQMVLTTPNAARLENVVAFIEGRNIYDPYSGYGPYGRHNREYTRHELHQLMVHCGFENAASFTANVHDDIPGVTPESMLQPVLLNIPNREHDLGQYLFSKWLNTGNASSLKPSWLYRSYPADALD
ncbi:class I SAM-dependent methyltransferase [Lysobacter soyae]|uniref:Class I SAM-dependent methyltransferase n=1 Tax=Lysobacter soyae TaxID=2764185 RepID=A0ABX8WM90_9GAMM|nr:methyltransferase domain-containing protein [Lysobacter sp. CJ11]QYR52741.1 class I SAM-dependent methyltransferase [Lysobacter sp. CJ11]